MAIAKRTAEEMPRIWRSPYSDFGHAYKGDDGLRDETITADEAYTDEVLEGIAAQGFNGIWVHGLLRHVVRSDFFRQFGRHAEVHRHHMNRLITRAADHGIKVHLYCQPPRGVDAEDGEFWREHGDAAGVAVDFVFDDGGPDAPPGILRSLCTSTEKVKGFLRESSERLFRDMPNLGGVILITDSEYPSHCWARHPTERKPLIGFPQMETDECCPRCGERHPAEVISEIIQLVRDGIRAASKVAVIIVWDWCWWWHEKRPHSQLVGNLPSDVIVMSGFEQGGRRKFVGRIRPVEEYSLSYTGPAPHFRRFHELARKRGLRTIAKLQIGTTHELGTVPNLPLIGNLYDKVRAMRKMGVGGYVGCWNFGNMATANSAAFNRFFTTEPLPPRGRALREFAEVYFPACHAATVVAAWESFAIAMSDYPFQIRFLYSSPTNYSLAYPIFPRQSNGLATGRSWLDDVRGENLENSLPGFTLEEIIGGLGRLARRWKRGAEQLEEGLTLCDVTAARAERDNAWVCYHIWRSTWNSYRAWRLRRSWRETKLEAYLPIARDELANLEAVLPIVEGDERFGWHSDAQAYLFDAERIRQKIADLERQLN